MRVLELPASDVERVFIAVWLPSPIAESLRRLVRPLLDTEPGASQSTADRYHVTVRFVGDITAADVERLVQQLTKQLVSIPPFDLSVYGAGRFDPQKVVWARLAPSTELARLERAVSKAAEDALPRLGRRRGGFRPHITLARRVPTAPRLDELLMDRCRSEPFRVAAVDVVAHPLDDHYRRLAAVPLGAASR